MCTLVILSRPGHRWPLIVGANREEMADRPWAPPGRHWPDRDQVVAGQDLEAGGSWLGINDFGVVAGIMNRRGSLGPKTDKRSRGELVLEALDHADDLVTGGQWRLVGGQFSLDDVEIGATDPTGGDLDPDLAGPRPRRGYVLEYEGSAGHGGRMLQAHGLHNILIPPSGQQMVSARPAAS
ncbi:MAG: NRDE family protein [Chloroflexi bacterium]|nr:NRDE family protein [Chloroflexota bacterium]